MALHRTIETMDLTAHWQLAATAMAIVLLLLVLYLVRLNQLLLGTPEEIQKVTPTRWT